MADIATLTARLAEAEAALHQLSTGGQVVSVRNDLGEQVNYEPADAVRLRSYIRELQRDLGQPPRRAIRVGFR